MKLNAQQAAECLFALLQERRNLHGHAVSVRAEHEAAARALLLDVCEGRLYDFSPVQPEIANVAGSLLLDLLTKLMGDPAFQRLSWDVPNGLTQPQRALHIVRHEIQRAQARDAGTLGRA